MAKCIRCGKSTLTRGHVKLADGIICTPCFKQLGFKIMEAGSAQAYDYDLIKDGKENISRNMAIRKKAHEKWLEEHPDVVSFMEALDEAYEDESDEAVETDENQED